MIIGCRSLYLFIYLIKYFILPCHYWISSMIHAPFAQLTSSLNARASDRIAWNAVDDLVEAQMTASIDIAVQCVPVLYVQRIFRIGPVGLVFENFRRRVIDWLIVGPFN